MYIQDLYNQKNILNDIYHYLKVFFELYHFYLQILNLIRHFYLKIWQKSNYQLLVPISYCHR